MDRIDLVFNVHVRVEETPFFLFILHFRRIITMDGVNVCGPRTSGITTQVVTTLCPPAPSNNSAPAEVHPDALNTDTVTCVASEGHHKQDAKQVRDITRSSLTEPHAERKCVGPLLVVLVSSAKTEMYNPETKAHAFKDGGMRDAQLLHVKHVDLVKIAKSPSAQLTASEMLISSVDRRVKVSYDHFCNELVPQNLPHESDADFKQRIIQAGTACIKAFARKLCIVADPPVLDVLLAWLARGGGNIVPFQHAELREILVDVDSCVAVV